MQQLARLVRDARVRGRHGDPHLLGVRVRVRVRVSIRVRVRVRFYCDAP